MSRIRSTNTKAELTVRSQLHRMGYRFRLYCSDLAGNPDIVIPKYKKIIFVHGCFWHRHGCSRSTFPKSNQEYWSQKFKRNIERFKDVKLDLEDKKWNVNVIWECQIKDQENLKEILKNIML